MTDPETDAPGFRAWAAWALGSLFFCFAFFLRVAPSVMVEELMREFAVGAAVLGNLSAFYLYAYASLQIPVGLLLDRYGPRRLVTAALAMAALGCVVFGTAEALGAAYAGRLMIGIGAAFSWVSALTLVTLYFPASRFAFLVGLVQMIGMAGAVFGQGPLAALVAGIGWRGTLFLSCGIGAALGVAAWMLLRDRPRPVVAAEAATAALFLGLRRVALNLQSWLCALFGMAMTAPMLSFAGLWAVPWLVQIHGLDRPLAAALASVMFAGFGTGAPILGWLSDRWGYRRRVLLVGGLLSILALSGILYLDGLPLPIVVLLFYLHGFGAGVMIVGFAAVRELNPPTATGAAYGLVNTFVVGSGALFQPLIGWFLDLHWDGKIVAGARIYSAPAYGSALSSLVAMVAIGLVAALFIRETRGRQIG